MNRFNLPDINFLEKSPESIEKDMLFTVENMTGLTLSNADPRRKFLQACVSIITQERSGLDYSLKQSLLAYAEDEFLDHQGEGLSTPRLGEKSAATTMEFDIEPERVDVLVIKDGTRFLVGEDTFFQTKGNVVVPVNQNTVQIIAVCTEEGTIGNGYLPGEITNLVDPTPWVKSVKNITTSSGGADLEENDPYAERIRMAPESFSVAGPEGAYKYWVKSISQDITDVEVSKSAPGTIDIRVLLKNGVLPSQELLDEIKDYLLNQSVRPLTDLVEVDKPEIVQYDPKVQYWVLNKHNSVLSSVQAKVEEAFKNYLTWQKEKMGRDIDLTELITLLKNAGAYRVNVISPMYQKIEKYQIARESVTELSFEGLTDE